MVKWPIVVNQAGAALLAVLIVLISVKPECRVGALHTLLAPRVAEAPAMFE